MKRRDVIKGGAAVAASWVAAPRVWAEAEPAFNPADEPWVALLSDTHIDADPGREVRGVRMAENLSRVLGLVKAGRASPSPEAVLINGDIARDEGRNGDYLLFNQRLEEWGALRSHTHVLPGNHDHRGNMIDAGLLSRDEGEVDNRRCRKVSYAKADWYLLDSLRYVDEIAGELGADQLNWLAQQLDTSPADRPAMVLTHHQPEDPIDPDDDGFGLADGQALMELLTDRQQVKAVFHGHRHEWGVREMNGLHIVGLPSTAYVFKKGEPSGYVEARVRDDHIELTRRCIDQTDPAERQVHRLVYRGQLPKP